MNITTYVSLFLVVASSAFSASVQAMGCPSASMNEVRNNETVATAMDTAWSNSKEGTEQEHIEGFNIYQCYYPLAVDGDVFRTELDWGIGRATSITYPSNRADSTCRLVGNFHTHPGVGANDPNKNDPYASDRLSPSEEKSLVPGVIRFGLGPISGAGKTSDIVYGPAVNPGLTWTCDSIAATTSGTGTGTGAATGNNDGGPTGDDGMAMTTNGGTTGAGTTTGADSTGSSGNTGGQSDGGSTSAGNTGGSAVALAQPVSYADPHIITLDGVAYSFQAVGEFVLAQSELDNFVVQVRQTQTEKLSSQVSINTGFAFKVGSNKISIAFNASDDLQIFVNNEERVQQGTLALPGGGQLVVAANDIQVSWPDGSLAIVHLYSNFLNLSLFVADVHKGRLSGLLGNFDGVTANDMRTSLGADISLSPQANQLYGVFAQGWRVRDDNSLFVYFAGQDAATFANRLFPGRLSSAADLSVAEQTTASQFCDNAGITVPVLRRNCIDDVGSTQNTAFAEAIVQVQNDLAGREANLVELTVRGKLTIPELSCSNQALVDVDGSPVPDISGKFIGDLGNRPADAAAADLETLGALLGDDFDPVRGILGDMTIEFKQCGPNVYGLYNYVLPLSPLLGLNGGEYERRFEGVWRSGTLFLNFAYPHLIPAENEAEACLNMAAQLRGNAISLRGDWTSSNCTHGGDIIVGRE